VKTVSFWNFVCEKSCRDVPMIC